MPKLSARTASKGLGWWRHLISWFPILIFSQATAFPAPPAPLTKIEDVRRLSRDEAAKGLPVSLTGVCVAAFSWGSSTDFVMWADGESIWISTHEIAKGTENSGIGKDAKTIKPGMRIKVEGVTDPGSYAPSILPSSIIYLGDSPVPPPKRVDMERILSGNEDGQWIELQGVVQEAFVNDEYPPGTGVMMMVSGHRCRVVSTSGMRQDPHELVDAEVLVRGVFAPDSNYRAEFAQPKLLISGLQNDFQIIKQPDADPFNAQRVELNRLLPFSPDAKPYHRKVVTGTVTFAVPGKFFFIESKGTGVRIDSPEIGIQCGRRVEVAGFVDTAFTFASLKNAIVRDLGPAPVPDPVRVTGAQLLDPSLRTNWGKPSATDFGGRSVKVRGTIRRVDWKEPMVPDALVIDVEGEAKKAFLPLGKSLAPGAVSKWIPGAKIEVSGICEYEFPFKGDIHGQYGPISFHLWVKDPGDVTILAQAPWWTPTRLLTALAGLAIALSAAIVWTVLLKTQVRTQTRIIQEKVRAETTNAERSRIARDLHDDLGANLTQIGLLSELTRRELEHPKRARELLDNVFDAAHALARQLDAAVWAINPSNDSLDSLVQYLCKYAQEFLSLADIRCRLDVAMDLPNYALSSLQRHNLFLAVKEAINNVVRHAGASIVILRVNIENNTSIFEIEDDGVGISEQPENEGHDGLGNMPLRMKQLGGEFFRMTGKGGKGTIIRLSMPLKNSNEQK